MVISWECPPNRRGATCWYTRVSNMYIHDCVRLAQVDEMAPDAKEADRGALCLKARLWDICYPHLYSFYKCTPHSRGYR